MNLENCLAALEALPNNATHFEMPFRLVSDFEQTQALLEATKKQFWELLKSKKIRSVNVLVNGKLILTEDDVKDLRLKLALTNILSVNFIVDGRFAAINIATIRKALSVNIEASVNEKCSFNTRNLTQLKPETILKQLDVYTPLEYVNIYFRPRFGNEAGALTKEKYQKRLVADLKRVKPKFIRLALNNITDDLKEEEVLECFSLFKDAGCFKVLLNLRGLPVKPQKLLISLLHKMMVAEDSLWEIGAGLPDHVEKFQDEVKRVYKKNEKNITPQRKIYKDAARSSIFKPSKPSGLNPSSQEPNLTDFFSAYLN